MADLSLQKIQWLWARELARQLRALAALPNYLDSIPSTHTTTHFSSRDQTDIYAGKTPVHIK